MTPPNESNAGLVERLKQAKRDIKTVEHIEDMELGSIRKMGLIDRAITEAIAALASPSLAEPGQSNAEIAARKECETMEWKQDTVNPTQVVSLLQQFQFIERPLDVPKPLIAAARYALQYYQNRVQELRAHPPALADDAKFEELLLAVVDRAFAEGQRAVGNVVASPAFHASKQALTQYFKQVSRPPVLRSGMEWPKDTAARRREDMSATGVLMLCLDADNDVGVAISKGTCAEDAEYASVEFCSAGSGSGLSLISLSPARGWAGTVGRSCAGLNAATRVFDIIQFHCDHQGDQGFACMRRLAAARTGRAKLD